MKYCFILFIFNFISICKVTVAKTINPELEKQFLLSTARISDFESSKNIIKVFSSNLNFKFFQDGDPLKFKIINKKTNFCKAHVRSNQKNYLVLFVDDWSTCWSSNSYFMRGTILLIKSKTLVQRIQDAVDFNHDIVFKKKSYLHQLNKINNFLWQYNEQKLKLSALYENEILKMKRKQEVALEMLKSKKMDYFKVRTILQNTLDQLDQRIKFNTIEKQKKLGKNLYLGLPIIRRPYQYTLRRKEKRK